MKNQWKLCRIGKSYEFSAAHKLPLVADGHKCKNLHGHNYIFEVEIRGEISPKDGFCNNTDFYLLDKAMQPILKALDHHYLNDIEGLDNPTAEIIAAWILDKLNDELAAYFSVKVWETPKCWAQVVSRDGWYQKEHRE